MLPSLKTIGADIDDALRRIEKEDFEGAIPILARVVAFAPKDEDAYVRTYHLWLICHVRLERWERALQLAEEGLARGILPAELLRVKCDALRGLQRFDEAAAAAEAAHELDPDSADPLYVRAIVEIERGRLEPARQLLRDAVRRHPEDVELHELLLEVAENLQDHALVIEAAREYLRRFEKDPRVLAILGRAYVGTGDLRRADRAFRDAAHLEPEEVAHHASVLLVALLTGNDAAYDAWLRRLGEKDPELAERAARTVGQGLAGKLHR